MQVNNIKLHLIKKGDELNVKEEKGKYEKEKSGYKR